jgi:hypothetical protein
LTPRTAGADNVTVAVSRRWHGVAACLTAVGVAALPLLPPEHRHRTSTAAGDRSEIVHRHFEPHHDGTPGAGVDHPAGAVVQWIGGVCAGTAAPPRLEPPARFVVAVLEALDPGRLVRPTRSSNHDSVHDPPWLAAHGLRGPPPAVLA